MSALIAALFNNGRAEARAAKCRLACSARAHSCARPTNQTERNQPMKKKTYQQITKGMKMKNWEIRERSDGKRFLYVRYIPKAAQSRS